MNAILIPESQLLPQYNANLLNNFATFNQAHSWTVQSGSGSGTNIPSTDGIGVLRVTSPVADGIVINSGGTETEITIEESGTYIFSFKTKEGEMGSTNPVDANVRIFVNGSLTNLTFAGQLEDSERSYYRTYFASLALELDDTVSFSFQTGTSDVGLTYKKYYKELKLEKAVGGVPTVYTLPQSELFTGTFLSGDDPVKTVTVVNGKIISAV